MPIQRAAIAVATLILILLSGCLGTGGRLVEDWSKEANEHGPMGHAATLALEATDYVVVGKGHLVDVQGPFHIETARDPLREGRQLFFHATVLDHGTGLLALSGERIEIQSGRFGTIPFESATVRDGALRLDIRPGDVTEKPRFELPQAHRETDSAWFFADGARITANDVVANATHAVLFLDGNATEVPLPVHFDATYVALHGDGRLVLPQADARFDRFGYSGATAAGHVRPVDGTAIAQPRAVFGDDATLRLRPDGVTSTDTFRLTQAITGDGYALRADVQMVPEKERVEVAAGNTTWGKVHYRERGYAGVAVLENVTVTGPAAALVQVPLEHPPWLVETLFDLVGEAGLAAPFLAIPLGIASPYILLGEAILTGFDCLFNDCPSQHPYPGWMQPGQLGRFYYRVDAREAAPGTYTGTIRFIGANHDPVDVPIEIVVM